MSTVKMPDEKITDIQRQLDDLRKDVLEQQRYLDYLNEIKDTWERQPISQALLGREDGSVFEIKAAIHELLSTLERAAVHLLDFDPSLSFIRDTLNAFKGTQPHRETLNTLLVTLVSALEQAERDMHGMILGMSKQDTDLWKPSRERVTKILLEFHGSSVTPIRDQLAEKDAEIERLKVEITKQGETP